MNSVLPHLIKFSNTAFKEIHPEIHRPRALLGPQTQKLMLDMWPYMLTMTTSASEGASMVAALVRALLTGRDDIPTEELENLLSLAAKTHRFNLLVRRLETCIRSRLTANASIHNIRECLDEYLVKRQRECRAVAQQASNVIPIGHDDVLVVYGYSHTVSTFITEQLVGHSGPILVVECRRKVLGQVEVADEAERVLAELQPLGRDCKHVSMASLPAIFSHFKRGGKAIKVLLGARGVFKTGSVLSTVGSYAIASIAGASDVEVFVLVEDDKIVVGEDEGLNTWIDEELERQAKAELAPDVGVPRRELVPPIDHLDRAMYTRLITSSPVARRPAGVTTAEQEDAAGNQPEQTQP